MIDLSHRAGSRGAVRRTWLWLLLLCAGVAAIAAAARAQIDETEGGTASDRTIDQEGGAHENALNVELDVRALLSAQDVLPDQVEDELWTIRPRESTRRPRRQASSDRSSSPRPGLRPGRGRRGSPPRRREIGADTTSDKRTLLALPLRITPGNASATLDATTVRVRGGTLLAWQLGRHDDESDEEIAEAEAPVERIELPPGTPTMARKVTVEPDGILTWKIEKITGGELKSTETGYDLKIEPSRILRVKLGAGDPPAKPTGPKSRESSKAYRTALKEYRQNVARIKRENADEFRFWTEQVRSLPDEFQMEVPRRIWAVYEMRPGVRELSVELMGSIQWRVPMESLIAMQSLGGGRGGGRFRGPGGPSDDVQRSVRAMHSVAARDDPYSQRLVAHALADSTLIEQAEVGGGVYDLLNTMVESPDPVARRTVTRALLESEPTEATTKLVAAAVPRMDAASKLAWLNAMLGGEDASRRGSRSGRGFPRPGGRPRADAPSVDELAVAAANQLLSDPNGLAPALILEQLMARFEGGRVPDEAAGPFTTDIRFDQLEGARRDDAIVAVIRHAGENLLAAQWLDRRLLGESAGREMQLRTLQLLSQSFGWHDPFTVAYDRLADLMFGPAEGEGDTALVTINAPIPIRSARHGLFHALQHGDPRVSDLAWQALPKFTLPGEFDFSRGRGAENRTEDPLQTLLTVARGQPRPRRQMIEFLRRQPDQDRATTAMVWLVADSPPAMSVMSAQALLGSDRPIGQVLTSTSFTTADRHRFAQGMYRLRSEQPPLVVGLIRQDDTRRSFVQWFADQVAAGHLPEPSEWAAQFGQTTELLIEIASSDPDAALAMTAALIATAGGDDSQAARVAEQLRDGGDTDEELTEKWDELRGRILADRVGLAAGSYRLTLRVYPVEKGEDGADAPHRQPGGNYRPGLRPGPGGPYAGRWGSPGSGAPGLEPPAGVPPDVDSVLGVVQLSVEGETVYLGNRTVEASVADDRLAIEINIAQDLKNLADALSRLPLEEVALVLFLPHRGDHWRSVFALPDGRITELLLERASP